MLQKFWEWSIDFHVVMNIRLILLVQKAPSCGALVHRGERHQTLHNWAPFKFWRELGRLASLWEHSGLDANGESLRWGNIMLGCSYSEKWTLEFSWCSWIGSPRFTGTVHVGKGYSPADNSFPISEAFIVVKWSHGCLATFATKCWKRDSPKKRPPLHKLWYLGPM